jgi:hypothetical protein
MQDKLNELAVWFLGFYNPQLFCEVIVPMATGFFN